MTQLADDDDADQSQRAWLRGHRVVRPAAGAPKLVTTGVPSVFALGAAAGPLDAQAFDHAASSAEPARATAAFHPRACICSDCLEERSPRRWRSAPAAKPPRRTSTAFDAARFCRIIDELVKAKP